MSLNSTKSASICSLITWCSWSVINVSHRHLIIKWLWSNQWLHGCVRLFVVTLYLQLSPGFIRFHFLRQFGHFTRQYSTLFCQREWSCKGRARGLAKKKSVRHKHVSARTALIYSISFLSFSPASPLRASSFTLTKKMMENTKIQPRSLVAEIQLVYHNTVKPSQMPKVTCSKDAYDILIASWDIWARSI